MRSGSAASSRPRAHIQRRLYAQNEQPDVAGLPAAWQELAGEIDPEDPDADAEAALIRELAGSGVPLPDYGEEVHGVIANVSWPEQRIVVDLDLTDDDRDELAEQGWSVVADDPGLLREALERAGDA